MAQDTLSSNNIGPSNSDSILDLLNDESIDNKTDETPEKEDTQETVKDTEDDDTDESDDESDDTKIDDEEDEENEIKLVDEDEESEEDLDKIVVPARKKEILAKYPKIFKDFPALETAYYKSQQYSEILPTIEDAKIAVEKAQSLDNFEKDILSGNLENLFNTVKTVEPKVFKKIADNLLTTIGKVDEGVQLHIMGNILSTALMRANNDGRRMKNDDLQAAAKILNEYIFGTEEIKNPTKLVNENEQDNTETERLNRERSEFEQERFNTALTNLQTKVDNTIKSTIDANIDPKESMSGYVKRNAVRDAFEQLEQTLNTDASLRKTLDNLWKVAKEAKYSSSSLDRIRAAYLSKAKTLLPSVIRNARAEALKGIGKQDKTEKNRRGPIPAHRSSNSPQNTGNRPKEIPRGMSNKDFIMQD